MKPVRFDKAKRIANIFRFLYSLLYNFEGFLAGVLLVVGSVDIVLGNFWLV